MMPPSGPDQGPSTDGRSQIRMPAGELTLLVAIAVFAVFAFLPLTHGVTIAGVSLIAWELWFLMFAAPAVGLVLATRGGRD